MSKLVFSPLTVKDIAQETADAISVSFEIPEELKETFSYTHGQYLTLKFVINGAEVRRAYSMCSSPLDDEITVTIKRVKKGLVSNHVHDNVKPGQQIEVAPP